MSKEVCGQQYICPRTFQDYTDRRVIPYTQFAGKKLYKASHLEKCWMRIIRDGGILQIEMLLNLK